MSLYQELHELLRGRAGSDPSIVAAELAARFPVYYRLLKRVRIPPQELVHLLLVQLRLPPSMESWVRQLCEYLQRTAEENS